MPSYEHVCLNAECGTEFEDFYSIKAPVPPCPKCGQVAQRLISGGSGKGVVELYGNDLKEKCVAEGKQLQRDALKNETLMASLVGETKYHQNETHRQRTAVEMNRVFRRK